MKTIEANFDGLVGPTHNYAGLSADNIASQTHSKKASNPRQAALQGLSKMKALHDMGYVQGVLAPQARPDIDTLRQLGFSGSDANVLQQAAKQAPTLLAACCSASSMWTANAATVSPSSDTADGKVHFTPANLVSKFHRSIEPDTTRRILQATFNDDQYFHHHPPLPAVASLGDEGAANHTRFCSHHDSKGTALFVYDRNGFDSKQSASQHFSARQTLEASQAIVRQHQLEPEHVIYAQQHPDVIGLGVFHNDVIAVGNQNLLLCHERAFLNQTQTYKQLQTAFSEKLHIVEIPESQITVETAIQTYLFNSQLLSDARGNMTIIVPSECQKNHDVSAFLTRLVAGDNPVNNVEVFDLRQSMNNGGGPACLRLRVVMNEQELTASNQHCLMTPLLYRQLNQWIKKNYRDQLTEKDLADPLLLNESRIALDELTQIMRLNSIYPFQKN